MFTNDELNNFPKLRALSRFLVGHPGFIAGGCFKHLLAGDKPTDLDMFFRERKDFDRAIKYFKDHENFAPGYENKNVVSFVEKKTGIRVECIRKIFGSPTKILSEFDFTSVKMAYEIEAEPPEDEDDDWIYSHVVTYHNKFFEHLYLHRLVIDDKIPFPASTFNRVCKYAKYGFQPCRETKVKLLTAINDMGTVEANDISRSMYDGHD